MCGITGVFDLTGQREICPALLQDMNGRLIHRGPDGDGFHFEPGIGLGHRRLSVIDIGGGRQPLYNEDNSVAVTYNGEIYNFRELEEELRKTGHVFRTRCDTEVIVHAWEEWGVECVDRFNGMFAFAIWDRNQSCLFLARDRIGIKPLFYSLTADGFLVFASELKAMMCHPSVKPEIDPRSVEDYFAFGYVPDPATIYKNVHKLEPGCRALINRTTGAQQPVRQERYWDVPLDQASSIDDINDAKYQIISGLRQAVSRRLVADVPLGAFLSGGIDSSAVVAMMAGCDIDEILTCSIGFSDPKYDESRYADMVASAYKTQHNKSIVETADHGLLDKLVDIYDEPYADSSALPTYRVCQLARKHVTVALSGDGGDENFIGYRRYKFFAMEDQIRRRLPAGVRSAVFGPLGKYYPKLDWAPRFVRGKSTFEALARSSVEAYRHAICFSDDALRSQMFNQRFLQNLDGYHASNVFERHVNGKTFEDNLRLAQYLDFKTYLPGDILTKVDRASMAHSLEVRVPFLDHTFVENVAKISSQLKLHGSAGKHVLKKALEPHLPHEVLYRQKMGFAVPLDSWFRDSLKDRIAAAATSSRMKDSGFFNPAYLDRMVTEHQSGNRDFSSSLWSLLMFDGFLAKQ